VCSPGGRGFTSDTRQYTRSQTKPKDFFPDRCKLRLALGRISGMVPFQPLFHVFFLI
jgi:hypothetical protein